MGTSFQQSDSAGTCATAAFCSPDVLATTPAASRLAASGVAGSTPQTVTQQAGITEVVAAQYEISPSNFAVSAGTWTVRINLSTIASQAGTKWTATYVCQVSSGCANKASIASLTGQAIALDGTTGIKTMTLTNGVSVTLAAGDKIEILICVTNGSATLTCTYGLTPSAIVDTPLVPVAVALGQTNINYLPGYFFGTLVPDGSTTTVAMPAIPGLPPTVGPDYGILTTPAPFVYYMPGTVFSGSAAVDALPVTLIY